jgi:tripartite-type tricarboxylate transporter receptor subunit TctC
MRKFMGVAFTHRKFRFGLSALTGLCLITCDVAAQSAYPTRQVRIVVPSSPGGGTDILGRVLADYFSKSLHGQFYVENRPGAGQMLGIEVVAHAPPDGYTLLMAASTLSLNPVMYKNVKYDAVRDFAPISLVASVPNVLVVHPSVPAKTLAEFLALAKAKPGELSYASAGIGTSPHMGMELLKSMTGVDMQHVPFRGTAPAVTEVLSGRIPAVLSNPFTVLPLIESGQLRALAVTGRKRADIMPSVPTVAEAGVSNYEALQWYGLLAPAGTSDEIVNRLRAEVVQAVKTPAVKERLTADGAEPVANTPAEFAALIKEELRKWTEVARVANIQPQ